MKRVHFWTMILTLGTTPALQRTMTFASLTIDSVNRATSVQEYASGKGINVARVAHALKKPSVATGFVGGDSGAFCRRDLDAGGVGHDFVTVASKTRMCVTLIDQSTKTATELVEEAGPVTHSDVAKLLVKLELLLQHAQVLVLSGTLAPGCGDDFYTRCIRLAKTVHVPVIMDTRGAPLTAALSEQPLIVKPNRAELSATVNRPIESDEDLRNAMRAIVEMGTEWIAVTNGSKETWISDGRSFWRIRSPRVNAVNPIGSGDSFAAGIAVGLTDGKDVPQSCALGAACGAANAMTELAGQVNPENVESLLKSLSLSPLPVGEG